MPIFVSLGRFTEHGRQLLANGGFTAGWPRSIAAMQHDGGRVLASYGLFGEYDALVISEWPDEEAFLRAVGGLFKQDIINMQTSLAIPLDKLGPLMKQP